MNQVINIKCRNINFSQNQLHISLSEIAVQSKTDDGETIEKKEVSLRRFLSCVYYIHDIIFVFL